MHESDNTKISINPTLSCMKSSESCPGSQSTQYVSLVMPTVKNMVIADVYGKPIRALVDTGASLSCIAASLLTKLGINREMLQSTDTQEAFAVGGERHCCLGVLSLPISLNGMIFPFDFKVFENFCQPLILGMDFLTSYDAVFDISKGTLKLQDPDSQNIMSLDINSGIVSVSQSVTVQPQSVMSIEVFISNLLCDTHVLLEPSQDLPNMGLAGAKCLVDTISNDTHYMQVINPSDHPIFLPKGTCKASACAVSPDTVCFLDTHTTTHVQSQIKDQDHTIDFDLTDSDLTKEQKAILITFLNKHRSVFATELSELGKCNLQPHTIETGESLPIRQRFYRQSPEVKAEMEKQIDEMLAADIIEESTSMWQSPVVMVKKKNGQLRFAVDYRKLNSVTKQQSFPLPRLEDVFDTVGVSKAKIFSTLDLASGFWQIPMDQETAHKSAFVTPTGVFQWKRMPFGLVNAPASFQALMTQVLKGLNWKFCLVYVDDILVMSNSFEEHIQHLQQIFERLSFAGLTLKPTKCSFALKQVQYLGHVITKDGIQVDVSKTEAVKAFPTPKCTKDVRSFLGLCNYYRKFIRNFSTIAAPLTALFRKDNKFVWTDECQTAFDQLKLALTSPPILAYPDNSKAFYLTTDASGSAIGFILGQHDDSGKERVIAYGGRSLNQFERNYSTTERECLAVIEGIKTYHVYLSGKPFIVVTDHSALKWLQKVKQDTGRLARWSILLQGYSFEIVHRKGSNNQVADALSRRSYPEQRNDGTEPEDVIPCSRIAVITTQEEEHNQVTFLYTNDVSDVQYNTHQICSLETSDSIGKLQSECPDLQVMYQYFMDGTTPKSKVERDNLISESKFFVFLDNTLYHFHCPRIKGVFQSQPIIKQLAVPQCLRKDVLRSYHDSLAGGAHLGLDRTYKAIQLKYFWKGMYQNVADYIRSCNACQLAKKTTKPARAPLVNMPIEDDTFSRLHMDILGPLTTSDEGYKYILLVVDSFSKYPEAFPLKTQESKEIAQVLFSQIFARYGAPRVIVSDRGQNFLSKLVTAVCEIFQVTRHYTSAYHPQTNSACERMNSTIAQGLRTYINTEQTNWPKLLPGIMMALRMSPSTQSSGMSPYHLVFGKEMNLPFDTSLIPKEGLNKDAKEHVSELMSHLKVVKEIAKKNIQKAQTKQKQQYDKKAKTPNFCVGQSVLLHTNRVAKGLSPKLSNPWDGPLYIGATGPNNTYKIIRSSTNKTMKSFVHANRLKAYNLPDSHTSPSPRNQSTSSIDPQNFRNGGQPQQSQRNEDENSQTQASQPTSSTHTPDRMTQTSTMDNQSQGENTATSPTQSSSSQPASQTQENSDTTYNVDKLIRYKYNKGKKLFLVKWQGYSKRTWEPADNLPQDMVRRYYITRTQRGTVKRKQKKLSCFKSQD
ncbi:hypothetical protein FSP39_018216 [Pinctada imbricata]|uniref:RNA-directed DNA polymerase n=1 Tax=Pinctada imbricata TaxID=66713 RepID=A0AA89BNU4_PINIB|nr:hypothetical protein FSP39_018216 [Pinctada imbricata]